MKQSFWHYLVALGCGFGALEAKELSVLWIAGAKSHLPGEHEHLAGCQYLSKHLTEMSAGTQSEVVLGWPEDEAKVKDADVVVIYSDGETGHVAKGHLGALKERHAKGKGLVVIHYALEPVDAEMAAFWDESIGGHFDLKTSVNPIWKMTSPMWGEHEVNRGVKGLEMVDECYFHLNLQSGIVPVLQALPPLDSVRENGPRAGNDEIRKAILEGKKQTLAWVFEGQTHARGFAYSGGHFHRNWAEESLRRLVLQGVLWVGRHDIPANGMTASIATLPTTATIDDAIAKGDLEEVKRHLAAEPSSLKQSARPNGKTPIEQAVLRNKTDIALHLIQAGADVDVSQTAKRTLLHMAIDRNNPVLITALIKAGVNPHVRDMNGWTPMHHAAAKNQLATMTALLEGGANPMTLSELGGTPLHEAAASGKKEIIELLLKHKTDPKIRSREGVSAYDIAVKYKNADAIEVLKAFE